MNKLTGRCVFPEIHGIVLWHVGNRQFFIGIVASVVALWSTNVSSAPIAADSPTVEVDTFRMSTQPAEPTNRYEYLIPFAFVLKPEVRRCGYRGRRRFCDGPRWAPLASFEDAARRDFLGLGTLKTYAECSANGVPPALVDYLPKRDGEWTLEWPVENGYFGRGFGRVRRHALRHRLHKGIDIPAAGGSLVSAVENGLVIYSDNGVKGYGNLIAIAHEGGAVSIYAHNRANYVAAGQYVVRGMPIGEVGRTGLARGNHLHFEWRVDGRPTNPMPYMVGRPSLKRERALRNEQARRAKRIRAELAEARERAASRS